MTAPTVPGTGQPAVVERGDVGQEHVLHRRRPYRR